MCAAPPTPQVRKKKREEENGSAGAKGIFSPVCINIRKVHWRKQRALSVFQPKGDQGERMTDLSEQKGDNIRGLPVAGVEEVRQSHGRESCEGIGAVQSVVDPFGSPPLGSNYRSKTLIQTKGVHQGDLRALAPCSRCARRLLPGWSCCSGGTADPGFGVCPHQGRNTRPPAVSSPLFKQRGRQWRTG